ncbi:MAG: hypothetical protein DRP63_04640, partial [Planctomycetota bacterium]
MAQAEKIRNIALIGHSSCGKTSLAEALLYAAGATTRKGDPAEGTSVLDFEDEEREKRLTINSATAFLNWRDHLIHLVDLPGYLDFLGEMACGLMPVEAACVCVDPAAGVKVTTRKAWGMIADNKLPCMVVLTKVDQEPEKIEEVVRDIQEMLGNECVLAAHYDGERVVPLLAGGPDDMRTKFVEKIVESDEELMEKYLGGEEVSEEELLGALKKALMRREIVPIFPTSAKTDAGVAELLDFVVQALPNALQPPPKKVKKGDEEVAL